MKGLRKRKRNALFQDDEPAAAEQPQTEYQSCPKAVTVDWDGFEEVQALAADSLPY